MYELTYWSDRNGEGKYIKRDVVLTKQSQGILRGFNKSKFASFIVDDGEIMYIPVESINEVVAKRGFYGMEYRSGGGD